MSMSKISGDEDDLVMLQRYRPYLRSALALIIYLRYEHGQKDVGVCLYYNAADEFLDQLGKDVRAQKRGLGREQ